MDKWLELVKTKPMAFGLENGFKDLQDIHNEWIKQFILSDTDVTLQAHRGSFKTTCLSIAIAIMLVIYPHKTIMFLRKGDTDVIEIIAQISKLLETEMFNRLSKALYNNTIDKTKDSAFEIDTNLKQGSRGASQLIGIGIKSSLTGKHADIIITDDIVNINDRISKAHRERTKLAYQELENIKNAGGRFVNTGTPWHKEDAFTLMPNIKQYDCYSTGLMTDADIQTKRSKMSPSLFAANYELKHIASENVMFAAPTIDDGSNTEKIYNGICHIDAAYGGDDNSAFTILKEVGSKIYVYGKLKEMHIDDCLGEFEQDRIKYRAGILYNEKNADKGYLAKKIKNPVSSYHESMNKYIKISTYLRDRWGDIIFINETDRDYINQILDYNENAERDDAPDSLASLIRQISKGKWLTL